MIYGLYLSATGVLTNSYRQDVIANNLANSETVGFKKDVPLFQERLTAAQEQRLSMDHSDAMLEKIGGGIWASPTLVDNSQGDLEPTGNALDVAIDGKGFFTVKDSDGNKKLTRDGRFMVDRGGNLVLANDSGHPVLDVEGAPIHLNSTLPVSIGAEGQVVQGGKTIANLGVFDVADPSKLVKLGGTLMTNPDDNALTPSTAVLRSKFVERANVDPATELAMLMDTQRQLEANANMIRYQDSTLDKLVNQVGKIS